MSARESALIAALRRSPALLTPEAAENAWCALTGDANDANWCKAALEICTMSGDDLLARVEAKEDTAIAFADCALNVRKFANVLRAIAYALDDVSTRIEAAVAWKYDPTEILAKIAIWNAQESANGGGANHG